MRFLALLIIIHFCIGNLHAQTEVNFKIIDSIHDVLKNKNTLDSTTIARDYYKIAEIYRYSSVSDSAFYYYQKAEKIFKKTNSVFELAKTFYGIAVIQCNEKDYTGSEVTSIEAISLLETLKPTNFVNKYKSFVYNNLGIVFNELGLFEESLEYHKRSLKLKRNLNGDFQKSIGLSENNIAVAYKNSGQYTLAIDRYQKILSNTELIKNHPEVYVLALGNYANTLYLTKRYKKLPGLYLKALKKSDSINYTYNSIIIHQHLAEYYDNINNKDSAKYYAYKAKTISEDYNNDDLLKSLLLISNIESEDIAIDYLKEYVVLSDSLQKSERLKRDKFARIRFETNKIEQENIRISKERMWLLIISIVLILAFFLLYLVITQRNKNKELEFVQEQQKTNEEIYNLMLSQNENIEEARDLEKKRISQELHDGVLGRLFGTRLSLDSLNMSHSDEAIKTREQYIIELKTIEDDIRKVSHELNTDFVSGSGFIDIIKKLVKTQTLAYGFDYILNHDGAIPWDSVINKYKIHIYRIIQEALHNIYKHAQATHVNISFKLKNNVICLNIEDNGSGYIVNKTKPGIGLKNMKSRIKEINGNINIISEKDIGTRVTIKMPLS